MGVTGAGKSTFISKCCNQAEAGIGHSLKSGQCSDIDAIGGNKDEIANQTDALPTETKEIQLYTFVYNSRTIHLIDTPGFDDTHRSDSEVLRDLAYYLTASYGNGFRLSGIIYLHPITATRMSGSAFKNLRTFRKLCGRESMSSVIMATTMWGDGGSSEQHLFDQREAELKDTPEFWGDMVSAGSLVVRHTNDHASAMSIIAHLVERNTTTVLGLQKEMVDQHKSLQDTEAGREVESELLKERQRFERQLEMTRREMSEAIEAQDRLHVEAIMDEQQRFQAKIDAIERGREELRTDMERLIADRERAHKTELARYDLQLVESREARVSQAREMAEMRKKIDEERRKMEEEKKKMEQEKMEQARLERWRMETKMTSPPPAPPPAYYQAPPAVPAWPAYYQLPPPPQQPQRPQPSTMANAIDYGSAVATVMLSGANLAGAAMSSGCVVM